MEAKVAPFIAVETQNQPGYRRNLCCELERTVNQASSVPHCLCARWQNFTEHTTSCREKGRGRGAEVPCKDILVDFDCVFINKDCLKI